MTAFRSAQLATKTVADYYDIGQSIKISSGISLRDSLTVIDFYLQRKRREITTSIVACSRTPQWRYRDRYRCEVCSSIERLRSLMYNIRECEDKVHDICLPHNMRVSHQYTPEASTEYSTVTCSAS